MDIARRDALRFAVSLGFVPLTGTHRFVLADDKHHALYGRWHVRCPANPSHVDVVTDGTKQHKCKQDHTQCFVNGKVTVMCPNGHANEIDLNNEDVVTSAKCATEKCGKECEGW